MPFTLSKLPPAKTTDSKPPEATKPKDTSGAVLEMPLPMNSSPTAPAPASPLSSPPSPMAPVSASPLSSPPSPTPTPASPLLPASFNANTPTPKAEKKKDKKEVPPSLPSSKSPPIPDIPSTTTPPSIGFAPLSSQPTKTSKNVDKKPTSPLSPPLAKEKPASPPSWNNPEGKVAPTSYAPVTAAAPSTEHGSDHDGKPQPGEPPLAPAPGPVQMYHVHGSETLQDIARRTLGSAERWTDLHKLNPTLKPDAPLGAGTSVRLPGDACVQAADETEPVKALPALRPKPTPPKAKALPLTGTYQCSLDDKNQLTLPRAIRDQFGGSETVLVSPGPDKCLWLTNQPHSGAPGRTP